MSETAQLNVRMTGDSAGLVTEYKKGERATKGFEREVDKSAKTNRRFERSTDKSAKTLQRFQRASRVAGQIARTTAVAVTAAATAMAALTVQGARSVDQLAKTADKLGVQTEELASLRLAAEQTGVAVNQFDTALQRLTRRTAEAAAGTGEAQAAFRALGLDASELVRLSPDQILSRIADEFVNVQNQAQRVAIGFKLFDTEGVALVNTLALGASGLEDFARKAEIAGLTISREVARGVERANDSAGLLRNSLSGLGQQLAARSAPLLEAINNELFESLEAFGGVSAVADRVFNAVITGAGFVADAWNGLEVVALGVRAAWQKAGLGILAIVGSLDAGFVVLGNKVIDLINLITGSLNQAITNMVIKVRDFATNVSESGFLPEGLEQRARAIAETTDGIANALLDTRDAAKIARLEYSEFLLNANRIAAEAAETYTEEFLEALAQPPPSEGFEEWAARVSELARQANEEWVARQEELRSEATVTTDHIADAMGTAADKSKDAWADFGQTLETVFVETFTKGIREANAFARVLDSLQETFIRSIFNSQISPLFTGIGGPGLAFAGGAAGGAAARAGGGGLGGLFGGGAGAGLGALLGGGLGAVGGLVGGGIDFLAGAASNILGAGTGVVPFLGNVAGGLTSAGGFLSGGLLSGSAALGLGSLGAGALLGFAANALSGDDGRERVNIGALVNQTGRGGRFGEILTGASGLTFQGFQRRAGAQGTQAAADFAQTLFNLDNTLTGLSQALGANVDFSGLTGLGMRGDAGRGGPGNFFGLRGFNRAGGDLSQQADAFVVTWLEQVNEQLPQRVRQLLGGVRQTAQDLVSAFEAGVRLEELLDINVVRDINTAIDELLQDQRTLADVYTDSVENVLELAGALDGSGQSVVDLTNALTEQRTVAAQLAVAYREASIAADSLLGSTITRIRESLLSEEELYDRRRSQIADLTNELGTTLDPVRIRDIVAEIDRLANDAFNLLDETQQGGLAGGFVDTLTQINELAQQQIDAGLADLSAREDAVTAQIDFELAAQTMSDAANTIADAATLIGNFPSTITLNIPGVGQQIIDLSQIQAEVNI